jgi:GNAT superfamily N-acetyltransferase
VGWDVERLDPATQDVDEALEVYLSSGLGARRPVSDRARFTTMLRQADLVVGCRVDGRLVGVARSVSDFSYVTYLSDIAVAHDFQKQGIGRALIEFTRSVAPDAKIVLLSAPAATEYYPHIGFTRHESAWVLNPG